MWELLDAEQRESREWLDDFYSRLPDGDLVAYGSDDVERALAFGAVKSVLVASTVPRNRRKELETAAERQGVTDMWSPVTPKAGRSS